MGMFDYLRCELPLPDGHNALLFQTKDTDTQYLYHHTITASGRLVLHDYEIEETPKAERPYPNATEGSWQELCGSVRPKESTRRDVDQNFDGDVIFYPDVGHSEDVDYRATFRNGTCVEISRANRDRWEVVYPQTARPVSEAHAGSEKRADELKEERT